MRNPSERSETLDESADETLVGPAARAAGPSLNGVDSSGSSGDASGRDANDMRRVQPVATAERTAGDDDVERTRPLPLSDAPRQILNGRYELQERIASGGMAAVWRGHDRILDRVVAVKVLHQHLTIDDDFRERFRREAISAAKLSHPNIVGLYDTGADGDSVFLVMEFVEGATLRDVLGRGAALSPGHAATIGERVARALDSAHRQGLVHRDVKPANILIGDDGAVKVTDFGIAKADQADDLTKTGMVLGTAAYVAPEQILARPIDGKADQYALGCVLYEALTGYQPFKAGTAVATAAQRLERDARPLQELRTDVPPGLEAVIARAMAREPAARFPSAGHLADALSAYADADTDRTAALVMPTSETPPSAPPASPPARSHLRWLAPTLVLLTLVATLAALRLGLVELPLSDGGGEGDAEETTVARPLPLDPAALRNFDPDGDGTENPEQLPRLLDGNPETVWSTEGYEAPLDRLGKRGVGFVIDLGTTARVQRVELTTPLPGVNVELHAGDDVPRDPANANLVARVEGAPAATTLRPAEPVEARYLTVWITGGLQPDGDAGRSYARFGELRVVGAPITA